jgi:hypothetical protein
MSISDKIVYFGISKDLVEFFAGPRKAGQISHIEKRENVFDVKWKDFRKIKQFANGHCLCWRVECPGKVPRVTNESVQPITDGLDLFRFLEEEEKKKRESVRIKT